MGGWFSKVGTNSFYASLDKQLQHLQEDTQRLQVTAVYPLSRSCCSRVLPRPNSSSLPAGAATNSPPAAASNWHVHHHLESGGVWHLAGLCCMGEASSVACFELARPCMAAIHTSCTFIV